jgi:hypothetical protein
MKTQIENILKSLLGLPLWDIGRRPAMEWLAFGNERRTVITKNGDSKIVSEYSLHIQCSWRLRGPEGVIFGSHYRAHYRKENPILNKLQYRGNPPKPSLEQRVLKLYESRGDKPLSVLDVNADEVGGFKLFMSDGYFLEVFPDGSMKTEDWRLFQPYTDKEHFVSNGYEILID